MDKILVYDDLLNEVEKELVFLVQIDDKKYVLYKDIEGNNKEIYASYFKEEDLKNEVVKLYNDLTEEEYLLLESLYNKRGGIRGDK